MKQGQSKKIRQRDSAINRCRKTGERSIVIGAVNGARTRDLRLGKPTLYQLSYYRVNCDCEDSHYFYQSLGKTQGFYNFAGMTPIRIDISDYVHSGEGANGESLYHRTDPSTMIKLYNATAPREIIENELVFAHKVYSLGIPSPEPGEFVTDGNGRFGIRFKRIPDKISISRATGEHPERVEEYARRFARLCRKLHATHLPQGEFPDIKEYYHSILRSLVIYTPAERAYLEKVIDEAPDGDIALHGDLQFSNAIMSGDRDYLIDLGDFACGSPLFDLGMVLFTCIYDDPTFMREAFHMEPETARVFWHYFVMEYYGEDADEDAIEAELRPYAAAKLLIIERNSGVALQHYHWLLQQP